MAEAVAFDCLVCGTSTKVINMGIYACRACTVFYRRNLKRAAEFICQENGNCNENRRGIFACRKCRLERFEQALRNCTSENHEMPTTSSVSSDSPSHHSSLENSPSTSSIIDLISSNYRTMCSIRRSSELTLRGVDVDPFEASNDDYPIAPTTYAIMNHSTRILVSTLFDFASSTFPEFTNLPFNDQWLLIRNYHKIFHIIDASYRSEHRFGPYRDRGFGTYTTYLDLANADNFFSDCPDQRNIESAIRTLKDALVQNQVVGNVTFEPIPTEDEHIALIGLAFWTIDMAVTMEHDLLDKLSRKYRSLILRELNERFKKDGTESECAERIGRLYCRLQCFQNFELNQSEEYEVYRILDVFNDETFMYKMQFHRPSLTN